MAKLSSLKSVIFPTFCNKSEIYLLSFLPDDVIFRTLTLWTFLLKMLFVYRLQKNRKEIKSIVFFMFLTELLNE